MKIGLGAVALGRVEVLVARLDGGPEDVDGVLVEGGEAIGLVPDGADAEAQLACWVVVSIDRVLYLTGAN